MTMGTDWLALLSNYVWVGIAIGCIMIGYWMGRNSAELPMRSVHNPAKKDQGGHEDPGGDPFEEAMEILVDENERTPTL